MERLCQTLGAANRYCGVEVSKPMLKASRRHLKGWIDCGLAEVRDLDLRRDFPPLPSSVTLSILTIQFTPIEYRQRIIHNVFENLLPGGAFILVEKILADTDRLDQTMVKLYYDLKHQNGYTTEEIDRKRLALEGVLVPVKAAWNEQLLRRAGFEQVDCFWRWCNFAGWLASNAEVQFMYAYPEENAQSFEGPMVGFDFEAVFRNLDPGGHEKEATASASSSPETHTDGLRRVIDWILTEDEAAGMSATKTLVSVRTMAFAWAVFPALVEGKSQSQLARDLGVSRQFFSRQVISLQETLGIKTHTMRSDLARQAYREAKSRTRVAESNTRKQAGPR